MVAQRRFQYYPPLPFEEQREAYQLLNLDYEIEQAQMFVLTLQRVFVRHPGEGGIFENEGRGLMNGNLQRAERIREALQIPVVNEDMIAVPLEERVGNRHFVGRRRGRGRGRGAGRGRGHDRGAEHGREQDRDIGRGRAQGNGAGRGIRQNHGAGRGRVRDRRGERRRGQGAELGQKRGRVHRRGRRRERGREHLVYINIRRYIIVVKCFNNEHCGKDRDP
ncbi:uncharacterized protein LOC106644338 [Copidosoma floridanum]|uniref:uncharacterized protein LOC106644338 n=1 Tax=Copidosoma floridanum TaxID=29053 RepID=UPI000C6F92FB|nr:uncharacterized protein LOC106644338 [Copidosoma floridanum]